MDFLRLLKSLEEFLYEVMTWLLFYPRTMLRVLRNPIGMLRYSDKEQQDALEQQYTEALSPPLFLMVTILLSHMIELAGQEHLPTPTSQIAQQAMSSEQNLLFLRSMIFAIYPLMFAVARLKREGQPITRDTLRLPFYAQCYVAAPAAMAISLGLLLVRADSDPLQMAGLGLGVASATWFLWIETRWIEARAHVSTGAAAALAFRTWLSASLLAATVSVVVLGTL